MLGTKPNLNGKSVASNFRACPQQSVKKKSIGRGGENAHHVVHALRERKRIKRARLLGAAA
jgi:hypothetical protein